MPIDFFETEVTKAQKKFNQTYGVMVVCNIRHRQASIMSIIHLCMLCKRITAARTKDEVRGDIQEFIRIRNTINKHLNQIERRQHGSSGNGHQGQANDGSGNRGRVGNHLQELREHLPQHLAESG